jgi:hypothetical protein
VVPLRQLTRTQYARLLLGIVMLASGLTAMLMLAMSERVVSSVTPAPTAVPSTPTPIRVAPTNTPMDIGQPGSWVPHCRHVTINFPEWGNPRSTMASVAGNLPEGTPERDRLKRAALYGPDEMVAGWIATRLIVPVGEGRVLPLPTYVRWQAEARSRQIERAWTPDPPIKTISREEWARALASPIDTCMGTILRSPYVGQLPTLMAGAVGDSPQLPPIGR